MIYEMIGTIISKNVIPKQQEGEVVEFQRRTKDMSDICSTEALDKLFDLIRMLDIEDYPKAFLESEYFRFEFSRASLKGDNSIIADVRITKK